MPILKPDIQKALRQAGLSSEPTDANSLQELLTEKELTLSDTLDLLKDQLYSSNEAIKQRAVDNLLKLHGVLKEQPQAALPSITIVIKDPGREAAPVGSLPNDTQSQINPILIPRQIQKGAN